MEHFGPTFKKLRLKKGKTSSETAQGIMSVQFLSQFEKGLSDISMRKLNKLLKRLLIPWKEFIHHYEGETVDEIEKFDNALNQNLYTNNFYAIKNMADDYAKRYQETSFIVYSHLAFIANCCISLSGDSHFSEPINSDELAEIKAYLFSIENWGNYETYIFGSLIYLFTIEEIQAIYKRVLKKAWNVNPNTVKVDAANCPIILLVNISSFFIRNQLYDLAEESIELSLKYLNLPDNPHNFFEKILIKFNQGIIMICKNDSNGIMVCKQCLDTLTLMGGYDTTVNNMYRNIKKNIKNSKLDLTF